MSEFKEPVPGREKPENFDEVVRDFQARGPLDRLVRLELLDMAEGENPNGGNPDPDFKGVREEYYPGWSNEDFADLLAKLGYPLK